MRDQSQCPSTTASVQSTELFQVVLVYNEKATAKISTLSLHDALPIFLGPLGRALERDPGGVAGRPGRGELAGVVLDRKSTRLNSSHSSNSYAVFCLIKKI